MDLDSPADAVVLVGGGLAAVSAARALRGAGYDGPLALVCEEDGDLYDRPPLSKQYLAGKWLGDEIRLLRDGEAQELKIDVRCGTAAGLDIKGSRLILADGDPIPYRALLIATGAGARELPMARGLAGVHYLRSKADADALKESMATGRRLVVVGAGFIGLEVAATAREAGLEVTVLEAASAPLTRVLGSEAGRAVVDVHADHGVDILFDATVEQIEGTDRVSAVVVRTPSGERHIPADLVVVGIGAVPRTHWLNPDDILVDDGVVCDSGGRTSVPGVYAAGDASRWVNELTGRHQRVEQWQAAVEQGELVGANIAADLGVPGVEPRAWSSVPYFWSDQFDKKIQFCGRPGATTMSKNTAKGWVACFGDEATGLTGVMAINSPSAIARGRKKIAVGCTWAEAIEWLEHL